MYTLLAQALWTRADLSYLIIMLSMLCNTMHKHHNVRIVIPPHSADNFSEVLSVFNQRSYILSDGTSITSIC